MDKYIKESELFKRILNVDFKHDYDGCIKFCQSLPAADVTEVRNGRWEDLQCTVCGKIGWSDEDDYCPNCGARMDEVEDEQ